MKQTMHVTARGRGVWGKQLEILFVFVGKRRDMLIPSVASMSCCPVRGHARNRARRSRVADTTVTFERGPARGAQRNSYRPTGRWCARRARARLVALRGASAYGPSRFAFRTLEHKMVVFDREARNLWGQAWRPVGIGADHVAACRPHRVTTRRSR